MKHVTLPSFMTRHWVLKLLSLFLGFCLWFVVVAEDQVDVTIAVPLEIHNLPPDLVISNQFKKDIEVSVRGPRKMLQELRQQGVTRPVDLSEAAAGTTVITNDEDSISFPKGVTVLRLQPANITLLLDELIRRDFTIEPVTEGVPAPGYTLASIAMDPPVLTVAGPKTLLEQEASLKTFIIDLDGLNQSTTLQAHLNLSKPMQELIGETVVTARLEVAETILTKTVRGIPINVRDNLTPLTTEPASVTVVAGIPENLIRDTPELAMLFRASVSGNTVAEPIEVEVSVSGIDVPGHAPIEINSILPKRVLIYPMDQDTEPATESPGSRRPASTPVQAPSSTRENQ